MEPRPTLTPDVSPPSNGNLTQERKINIMKRFLISIIAAIGILFLAGQAKASTTFQGITFTFTQVDADTLKFELSGTPTGDWSTAQYLAAFDLKDLGIDFGTQSGTANG